MWGALVVGLLARPWARRVAGFGLATLTIALFVINLRRQGVTAPLQPPASGEVIGVVHVVTGVLCDGGHPLAGDVNLSAAYPAGRALTHAATSRVNLSAAYPAGRASFSRSRQVSHLSAAYPAGRSHDTTRPTLAFLSAAYPAGREVGPVEVGPVDLSAAYPAGRDFAPSARHV